MSVSPSGAKHGLGGVQMAAQVLAAPGLKRRDGQWGACQDVMWEPTGDLCRGPGSSGTQGPSLQWALLGATHSARHVEPTCTLVHTHLCTPMH